MNLMNCVLHEMSYITSINASFMFHTSAQPRLQVLRHHPESEEALLPPGSGSNGQLVKMTGKPWETIGKPWENHRKTIGKP